MKRSVKPGEWISVNKYVDAVVCNVYDDHIEVVYLSRGRAVNEDVVWDDEGWQFQYPDGPCGGYADQYPRLATYCRILHSK